MLSTPETAEEWLPVDLGVKRVERLDPTHIFQAIDIPILMGMAHFARQTVVQVRWDEHESRLRSCWTSDDPARWAAATAGYDTGAAWQTTATGGWNVTPAAGGSIATYRVWADVQTVIPGLQSWAMARSLPSMIVAYDARVGALAGSK